MAAIKVYIFTGCGWKDGCDQAKNDNHIRNNNFGGRREKNRTGDIKVISMDIFVLWCLSMTVLCGVCWGVSCSVRAVWCECPKGTQFYGWPLKIYGLLKRILWQTIWKTDHTMKMFPVPMTRLFCFLYKPFTSLAGTVSTQWLLIRIPPE